VNKQNFRYWAKNNPRIIHERPPHSPKLTVWCAVSQLGEMCERAVQSFTDHFQQCVAANGPQLKDIIFKSE
jgi:hypothetical protein